MTQVTPHLVIVGAGISGLAAAWAAQELAKERHQPLRITVLEAASEVGGKAISTTHAGGWTTEAGPTGFLDNEPVLDKLIGFAGLTKRPASEAAARRFVVQNARLREIHAHPLRFARSGILSPLGLARILRERWVAKVAAGQDESVWSFAARRLGPQAADRLIQPMVLGVFAGDAKALSLPAAFPKMAAMEQEYGSLFKAMGSLRKARKKAAGEGAGSAGGPAGPAGALTSFDGGLQALPQALAAQASFEIQCGARVQGLEQSNTGEWVVTVGPGSETHTADALVLATEGHVAAKLLETVSPAAAQVLGETPHPGVQVLSVGFLPEAAQQFPQAFGCLIPRTESLRALGFLWDSHIFPGRAPEGHVLVRALYGGAVDPQANTWSTEQLLAQAQTDLRALFGITSPPTFHTHTPWDRAIPQYTLGHLDRVRQVEQAIEQSTTCKAPLWLAGNSLYGVAFGKAASRGWQVGQLAAQRLSRS